MRTLTIGFGFTSDWMKKWREFFKPIGGVESAKPITFRHSNENRPNLARFKTNLMAVVQCSTMSTNDGTENLL